MPKRGGKRAVALIDPIRRMVSWARGGGVVDAFAVKPVALLTVTGVHISSRRFNHELRKLWSNSFLLESTVAPSLPQQMK